MESGTANQDRKYWFIGVIHVYNAVMHCSAYGDIGEAIYRACMKRQLEKSIEKPGGTDDKR